MVAGEGKKLTGKLASQRRLVRERERERESTTTMITSVEERCARKRKIDREIKGM